MAQYARSTMLTPAPSRSKSRVGQAGFVRPLVHLQPDLGPPPRRCLARTIRTSSLPWPLVRGTIGCLMVMTASLMTGSLQHCHYNELF